MTEHDLQNKIRIELSKYGKVFRANVGKIRMDDGRYFDTGLPKGHSDLVFYKPPNGTACFIEVKVKPNKPTAEQLNFIKQMRNIGCNAGVAYSVKEALGICQIS